MAPARRSIPVIDGNREIALRRVEPSPRDSAYPAHFEQFLREHGLKGKREGSGVILENRFHGSRIDIDFARSLAFGFLKIHYPDRNLRPVLEPTKKEYPVPEDMRRRQTALPRKTEVLAEMERQIWIRFASNESKVE